MNGKRQGPVVGVGGGVGVRPHYKQTGALLK